MIFFMIAEMTKAVVMVMCLWESVKVTMGELLRKHISNLSSTSSDYRTALNVLIKYEIQCLVWTPLLDEVNVTEINCNISQWFIRILCPYSNTQEWLVWSNDCFLRHGCIKMHQISAIKHVSRQSSAFNCFKFLTSWLVACSLF